MDSQILQLISSIKEKYLLKNNLNNKIRVWMRNSQSDSNISKFGIYLCKNKNNQWCLIIFECFNKTIQYHGGEILRHIRTFKSETEVVPWLSTRYGQKTLIKEFKQISIDYKKYHWPNMQLCMENDGETVYEIWYMDYTPMEDPWYMCKRYKKLKNAVDFVIDEFVNHLHKTKEPDEFGIFFIYALTKNDIERRKEYIESYNKHLWKEFITVSRQTIQSIGIACNDICREAFRYLQSQKDNSNLNKEWKSNKFDITLGVKNNITDEMSNYVIYIIIPDIKIKTNGASGYYRLTRTFDEKSIVYEWLKSDKIKLLFTDIQDILNDYIISMPKCY